MRPSTPFSPRPVLAAALLFAATALSLPARAQTAATCSAGAPNFNYSLAVQQTASSSDYKTIAPSALANVLDIAECECGPAPGAVADETGKIPGVDLYLRSGVVSRPIAAGTEFHVLAGNSCNSATSQGPNCDNLDSIAVSGDRFSKGDPPVQAVPVISLVSPGTSGTHMCERSNTNSSIWFLFGQLSQPESCSVPLPYDGVPPDAPRNPRAGSGDEAVTLSWDSPTTSTTTAPDNYQVLCADEFGNPVGSGAYAFGEDTGDKKKLGYSTCVNPATHSLQRRVLPQTSGTSTADGGSSGDMGTAFAPGQTPSTEGEQAGSGTLGTNDEPTTQADPEDGGVSTGCDVRDGGVANPFATLDKKFVCSDILDKGATSTRITGLKNNTTYLFTVVAIDKSGNPTPSATICSKPQPVEDLWRRYLNDMGKPQGFCFIATAAFGSYQSPFVMVLRDFRDQVLLPTASGKAFVGWYYRTSPPIADWIRDRGWARFLVRTALWPVIVAAGLWMWMGTGEWLALGLLVAALVVVRRSRRRAARVAAEGPATPALAPLSLAGSEA